MILGSVIRYLNHKSPRNIITINPQYSAFLTNGNFCNTLTGKSCCEVKKGKSSMEERRRRYKLNILVLLTNNETQFFESVKIIVDQTKFVVYSVEEDTLGKTTSWMTGCRALIVLGKLTNQIAVRNINEFNENGGDVLSISELLRSKLLDILKPYSVEASENEKSSESSLDPGHLQNQTGFYYCEQGIVEKQIQEKITHKGKVGLKFVGCEEVSLRESLPETFNLKPFNQESKFDVEEYLSNLSTRVIGRHLINLQSVSSSMNVITGPLLCDGVVVIPDQQTAGEGRGGNRWISPKGCAMFSLQIHVDPGVGIGKTPSLVQHIVGLAVVQALGEDIQLRLKWPNDIYFQDKVKLGGVVVNSSLSANNFIINIGCGLNLNNALPTISVNQLLNNQDLPSKSPCRIISREEYIAKVLNNMEALLDKFNHGKRCDVIQAYHKVWLHTDQQVTILKKKETDCNTEEEEVEVKIVGIDDYGYLVVKDRTGYQFSVHDDGNSFDMMNGLIRPKF